MDCSRATALVTPARSSAAVRAASLPALSCLTFFYTHSSGLSRLTSMRRTGAFQDELVFPDADLIGDSSASGGLSDVQFHGGAGHLTVTPMRKLQ